MTKFGNSLGGVSTLYSSTEVEHPARRRYEIPRVVINSGWLGEKLWFEWAHRGAH